MFRSSLLLCILACENEIPSTCSFSRGFACFHVAKADLCNSWWSNIELNNITACPSTSGLVKDTCKNECENCDGK